MDDLVKAALEIASVECKADKKGCGGPWCEAQGKIRKALDAMSVPWKPAEAPEAKKPAEAPEPPEQARKA